MDRRRHCSLPAGVRRKDAAAVPESPPEPPIDCGFLSLPAELQDAVLLAFAEDRAARDSGARYSLDDVLAEAGISREELEGDDD